QEDVDDRFGGQPRNRGRTGMLNPQRLAPQRSADSLGFAVICFRPLRIVIYYQNSAGDWLRGSYGVGADLFLGEWWGLMQCWFFVGHWSRSTQCSLRPCLRF